MGFLALLLATQCPPALSQRADGLCYYNTPYLTQGTGGLRRPLTVKKNGFSPKMIDLGRKLFFEKKLSGNGMLSCGSCHQPDRAFTDGLARSRGRDGKLLSRSAPSLWNVAFFENYLWDGREKSLESQLEGPFFSPDEMNTDRRALERYVNRSKYRPLFQEAFGKRVKDGVLFAHIAEAIATYERSLVSLQSRYDRFVFGEKKALNPKEIRGFNLFRSFVTRCTECHEPPLFTNFQMARIGAPDLGESEKDPGLQKITGNRLHEGVFRVPSLRNIANTAPYMHSGVFPTLASVVAFYDEGAGRHIEGYNVPQVHWHVGTIGLSAIERAELVAFLGALTDTSGVQFTKEDTQ